MISGALCQRKAAGIERWFKFDGNLLNSGSLACTATLVSGSVSYSSSNANTGQSIAPSVPTITTSPVYALGTNFYVEFYATWMNDGIFNTLISAQNGINIAKSSWEGGKIQVQVNGSERLRSAVAYADGVRRKYKITFIAGVISLYVNDVLTDTGTTTITDFTSAVSDIKLFNGIGGGAKSGYYDDLIIHRL